MWHFALNCMLWVMESHSSLSTAPTSEAGRWGVRQVQGR